MWLDEVGREHVPEGHGADEEAAENLGKEEHVVRHGVDSVDQTRGGGVVVVEFTPAVI